jgi:hypothetical protein
MRFIFIAACLFNPRLLSTPPHGDAVGAVFGREQFNSTGRTFTCVVTSFTGVHEKRSATAEARRGCCAVGLPGAADVTDRSCSLDVLVCAQHGRVANGARVPCEKTET